MIYGALLAGFVPLSALMPSMVERHDKGAALAILNLGAGGAAFIGPAIADGPQPLYRLRGRGHRLLRPVLHLRRAHHIYRYASDPGEEGETEQDSVATA